MNQYIEFFHEYYPLFAILAAVATVLGVAFTIYKTAHDRQVKALLEQLREKDHEIAQKNQEIAELKRTGHEELRLVNEQLQEQLEQARKDLQTERSNQAAAETAWRTEVSALREQGDRLRQTTESLTETLEAARGELAARDRTDRAQVTLMKKAMRLQGKVWERKILQSAPSFRQLGQRHVAIISVHNLKGGVGKTTVTAHLGAALSAQGYHVLLVDLDLQGSLSSLFMNESALVQLKEEGRLLQNFLLNVAERRKANLLECCIPIFNGQSAIIPSADSMAYAELNLTMQWLLRRGKRDTRFLLRKALQLKGVARRFDIILLDCPPVMNTCCVNALAASDYVLIPVLPSRKATERVPLLLERLQSLHRVINPELQVIGVFLNRTHGAQLTAWERDLWADMLEHAKTQWKLPVPAFETFLRQTTEVRDNEAEFSPPPSGSELHTTFTRLVAELEERLPRDCCRTADAPRGFE